MSDPDDRSPRWLSALLVLAALGGLAFAIYRFVDYERNKPEPEPPPPFDGVAPGGGGAPPKMKQLIPPDKSKFKEKEKARPDKDQP